MEQDDVTAIIPSIKVHPFPQIWNVSLQGLMFKASLEAPPLTAGRKAFLTCPTCLHCSDLYKVDRASVEWALKYCAGNMPLELKCEEGHTHEYSCAGVHIPHFHVICMVCSEIHLLAVPGDL